MMTLFLLCLTLLIAFLENADIARKKKENDKTADESMRSFRETMNKLHEIREKDHRKL